MNPLVNKHIVRLSFVDSRGQINAGPEDSQNKRGIYRVTEPDILPQEHRLPYPAPQTQIAEHRVQRQQDSPRKPYPCEKFRTGTHGRACGFADNGIYGPVKRLNTALQLKLVRIFCGRGGAGINALHRDGLRTGNQAEHAFHRKRKNQPDRDQRPKDTGHPPWRSFHNEPQHNYRQNQPAYCNAPIQQH
ncbi:hypothetical protein SDC9_75017 [bioreactor metagenome]|uniref:Uncharacterized protein n=1 Tax=bioreactor metagenome TaxID=1076179 RepID=A0A644YKT2_9ZZZZ